MSAALVIVAAWAALIALWAWGLARISAISDRRIRAARTTPPRPVPGAASSSAPGLDGTMRAKGN